MFLFSVFKNLDINNDLFVQEILVESQTSASSFNKFRKMQDRGKSDDYEQFSDADGNSRNTSVTSETPDVNFDPKYSSYTDTMSNCSACMILSPYSQLFVCTKTSCGYSLKQTVPILSPSLFYRREKVFCGSCAFRGLHSEHKKYMQPAERLAFKTASGEVGTKLELKLEKFAEMSEETPVEYYITQLNGNCELPKIPVVAYLSSSKNIMEWHSRLAILEEAVRTLNECGLEGHSFVKQQAEKLLNAYSHTSTALELDTTTKSQEKTEIEHRRSAEHHQRMGIRPGRGDGDQSSYSSISSSSRRSSISNSSTNTVRQMTFPSKHHGTDDILDKTAKNSEFVDETVRQTIVIMSRKFEMLLRTMSAEESAQQIAEHLDSRIECVNHKQLVVKQMEKIYSIKWP